jgi:hypothetical protein
VDGGVLIECFQGIVCRPARSGTFPGAWVDRGLMGQGGQAKDSYGYQLWFDVYQAVAVPVAVGAGGGGGGPPNG